LGGGRRGGHGGAHPLTQRRTVCCADLSTRSAPGCLPIPSKPPSTPQTPRKSGFHRRSRRPARPMTSRPHLSTIAIVIEPERPVPSTSMALMGTGAVTAVLPSGVVVTTSPGAVEVVVPTRGNNGLSILMMMIVLPLLGRAALGDTTSLISIAGSLAVCGVVLWWNAGRRRLRATKGSIEGWAAPGRRGVISADVIDVDVFEGNWAARKQGLAAVAGVDERGNRTKALAVVRRDEARDIVHALRRVVRGE
jgi:hypothetical protein